MVKKISSLDNPIIKKIIRLRQARKKREAGLVPVEGNREIDIANQAGARIDTLVYCPEYTKNKNKILPAREIIEVTSSVFKKISFREKPDGMLALIKFKPLNITDIKLGKNPLVIILESIEKPGNIGAILRSADAAGVDCVIVNDPQTDIYNHNVIRASLGTVFTNKVVIASPGETKGWLKTRKIVSVATTPLTKKIYSQIDLTKPTAIIVGSESRGLSDYWLKSADKKALIPMRGKIDSLNASVSLAIVLFEAARQRGGS